MVRGLVWSPGSRLDNLIARIAEAEREGWLGEVDRQTMGVEVNRIRGVSIGGTGAVACTVMNGTPIAVTGGFNGSERVWNLTTGAPVHQPLIGHVDSVRAVACMVMDGTPIAVTGSRDGSMRAWNLATGTVIRQFQTGHPNGVELVACAVVDGVPVAVTATDNDNAMQLWNLQTGESQGHLAMQSPRPVALASLGALVVGIGHDVAVFRRRPTRTPR